MDDILTERPTHFNPKPKKKNNKTLHAYLPAHSENECVKWISVKKCVEEKKKTTSRNSKFIASNQQPIEKYLLDDKTKKNTK